MRNKIKLIVALLYFLAGTQPVVAQEALSPLNMPHVMENQGTIESLDLGRRSVTINGVAYPFDPYFEVVRHTPEGLEKMDPVRLNRNMRVGVEERNGLIVRLHVLDSGTTR